MIPRSPSISKYCYYCSSYNDGSHFHYHVSCYYDFAIKKGVRQAQKMRIFDSDSADLGPELADLGLGA